MRPSQYQRMLQELKDARERDDVLADHFGRLLSITEDLCGRIENLEIQGKMLYDMLEDTGIKCTFAALFGFCGGVLAGFAAYAYL